MGSYVGRTSKHAFRKLKEVGFGANFIEPLIGFFTAPHNILSLLINVYRVNLDRGLTPMRRTSVFSIFLMRRIGCIDEVVTDGSCISVQDLDAVLLLINMTSLSRAKQTETATTTVSMGVRGVTGNGGLYTLDSLVMWSATPIPPIADDLFRGPGPPLTKS